MNIGEDLYYQHAQYTFQEEYACDAMVVRNCDKVNLLDCVTYKVFSFHAFQELVLDYVMTLC